MNTKEELARLFVEVGNAHHDAFIEKDGDDPEWADWYASFLLEAFNQLLGTRLSGAQLAADLTQQADAYKESQGAWPEVYASELLAKYGK